jgi:penicillin amidase
MRDGLGVPHCYATTEHDAFFAQGWVHAADRFSQMEHVRRRGTGRLAEVVGAVALQSDLFHRHMDLLASVLRDWQALTSGTKEMLDAYAAGVNAAIATTPSRSGKTSPSGHREAHSAGAVLEPWEPWHSLLVFRVRHLLMGSARTKLWRAMLGETMGHSAADSIAGVPGYDQVACVPPGTLSQRGGSTGLGDAMGGSNNWVLSGSRTASGLPLLAGDPHRELESPNVYVQGHIACPNWDVLGLGIAGVPGFSHFGHNSQLAWCITHGMIDDQDLYHFSSPPPAQRRVEMIEVRGAQPVEVEVAISLRGPLIADDMALCWTATAEPNTGFDTFRPMLRAASVDELFDAMAPWVEPGNNLLAADVEGAIGYLTRGRVPIRSKLGAALLPVPGDDPSFRWTGWVPSGDLPRVVDPECGFLFSANNQILASADGPYLGTDVAAPWRAFRIVEVLSGLTRATILDMETLHKDVVSLPAQWVMGRIGPWAPLAGWDGRMAADSTAASAYSILRRELTLLLTERSGLGAHLDHRLNRLLPGVLPESALWRTVEEHLRADNTALLGGWSWDQAIDEAKARAERASDCRRWGELHATRYGRLLGTDAPDPPSVPYGGDMDTVQAGSYVPSVDLSTRAASVARYAFDLADWDRSGWVVPLGSAGPPDLVGSAWAAWDRHALDQQQAWQEGRLLPAPYSRSAVEEASEDQVTLTPG